MASIVKRKANYAVVYWYLDETDTRKQKWETCVTKKEANTRKTFIEYYQKNNGYVLVPLSEQYAKEYEESKIELENPDSEITLKEFLEIFAYKNNCLFKQVSDTISYSITTQRGKDNPVLKALQNLKLMV